MKMQMKLSVGDKGDYWEGRKWSIERNGCNMLSTIYSHRKIL